ncbi:endoribonuclease Dicer homolog 2-like [Corylus avellana]|uniref:endoribonuclease Dicer homolog 2-like n=1 Tax=Corylus avellana TaxID=13451 RepID=UPI00286A515E|nr:endoribonuclease Dicer homolog 2-like [Corylus avellana]
MDYLLLPPTGKDRRIIDWECIASVLFSCEKLSEYHWNCPLPNGYAHSVQTKDGCVCICMLLNSLVYTPHNGHVYCIFGNLGLNGNSLLELRDGRSITYKKYYEERHGLKLCFDQESLLNRRSILQRCRKQEEKGLKFSGHV